MARKLNSPADFTAAWRSRGNQAILHFDHARKGLEARGGVLQGFAICGEDRKFVWAKAEIVGDTVVVSSPEVSSRRGSYVRIFRR